MAERILMNEFRTLSREKWVNIELHNDDIFKWDIALIVLNKDSVYYGGYFKARMTFPKNYPYAPPEFRFLQPLYHPNIYTDGRLCISILHAPGEDALSGESAAERWSPAQRVESVLISILSLLDDAECSSPANVDAAVMFRTNHDQYCAIVKSQVEKSKTNMPPDFVMPVSEAVTVPEVEKEEPDFWADSDVDSDVFGGSDSDEDLDMDQSSPSDEDDDDEQQDMDEE
ncbi:Ubiquitin carrier protein [Penicillium daleae]|uniref:Ubiquitin-conjugating enzyme E2 2 n=1 Tax=Penicillium daleae TaxID=63821 RepID=A0AAD6CDQ5_9EURO|nr:Ubiquitin carrier protein [Penicillium daleae]KAJ5461401.1 Ubiquitin carrier protein [Penicillium daleae]